MPIYPDIIRSWYGCTDGAYSDHSGPGACRWHGGLISRSPIEGGAEGGRLGVVDVPLARIKTKPEWFQNRSEGFSVRSVDNIVNAVRAGKFSWGALDPITLWESPDGDLFVLSGHSRTEGFARLYAAGAQVDGRDFSKIPAKIQRGISEQEARRLAMESNTLATKESDMERAAYYRRLRVDENWNARDIEQAARRMEGRNANQVLALSYLSPRGKTWGALAQLQEAEDQSRGIMANVARWIGNARRSFPQLSDAHENELYDFLITGRAYGTAKGQISNEREFQGRLQVIVDRRTTFGVFDQAAPLNIYNLISKSPVEQTYDAQLEEARQNVTDADRQLKEKTATLAQRGATEEKIRELTAALEAGLRRARIEYQNLLQARGRVMEAAKNELNLFQISGFTKSYSWMAFRSL